MLEPSLTLALIAALTLVCQWMAWRTRVPSIVYLLFCGILAGPTFGLVDADALLGDLLFPVVSVAVAVILFEGSLTLRFDELDGSGGTIWRLLSVGMAVTWVVIAAAVYFLVGLSLELSVLFGAIMVVTGPTVIEPMLRSVRPNKKVARLLRWEGIVIDPLGAILAILVFDLIMSQAATGQLWQALGHLLQILGTGAIFGIAGGHLFGVALRRYWIPDYLHDVGALLAVVVVFVVSNHLVHESGLLAVTAMGVWMANMRDVPTRDILDFKESLSVLLISGLFILLASRLDLQALATIAVPALGVFLVTQFVARPLKILASTAFTDLSWQERGVLAWIAPRGIVAAAISALFALRLEEAGTPGAEHIVPLAFALIIGTVVWQGFTAPWVARKLGVGSAVANGVLFVGGNPVALALAAKLHEAGFAVVIADSYWNNIRSARMAGLPTFFGSPVSELAERKLDLTGIGHLFAMSRRDDLNALSCLRYEHEFGRDSIYSLVGKVESDKTAKHAPANKHRGRELFGTQISQAMLASLLAQGAEFRQTPLTQGFGFDDLVQQDGKLIPLLAWSEDGRLRVREDDSFRAEAGWTVLSLSPAVSQGNYGVGTMGSEPSARVSLVSRYIPLGGQWLTLALGSDPIIPDPIIRETEAVFFP